MPAWANDAIDTVTAGLPAALRSLLAAHPVRMLPVRAPIKTGAPDVFLVAAYAENGPAGCPIVVFDCTAPLLEQYANVVHEVGHHVMSRLGGRIDGLVQDAFEHGGGACPHPPGRVDRGEYAADCVERYFTDRLVFRAEDGKGYAMVESALAMLANGEYA